MTATPTTSSTPTAGAQPPPADLVTVTIDDRPIAVPKGTLVIRAAELLGLERSHLYRKMKALGIAPKE